MKVLAPTKIPLEITQDELNIITSVKDLVQEITDAMYDNEAESLEIRYNGWTYTGKLTLDELNSLYEQLDAFTNAFSFTFNKSTED